MADDVVPWTRKYLPKKASDLQGLDKAVGEVKRFITAFRKGKGLLLYGPTGSGKTSSVYAVASELGLELVEVNASDTRNSASIESIVGTASKQASLFFSGKVILVDEVDGLTGREDRGGVSSLVSVIESSSFPIIAIANDPFTDKLSPLRKKCSLVEFPARSNEQIVAFLSKVCSKEGIECEPEALSALARRSAGDLRAAINDLQNASYTGKLDKKAVEYLGDRERTEDIESALTRVFKTTDPQVSKGAFDNVDEDIDKIFLWVDENLPKEYLKSADLARGFEAMSKADVFKGRIMRWQHYRFYVYCYDLLSSGVALAKDERYRHQVEYAPTSRILKLWIAKQKNMKKRAIAEKIAERTHTSTKRAMQDSLPYVQMIAKASRKDAVRISEFLDLDGEQAEWVAR